MGFYKRPLFVLVQYISYTKPLVHGCCHCHPSALRESDLSDDRAGDEAISAVRGGQARNGEIASPAARNDKLWTLAPNVAS